MNASEESNNVSLELEEKHKYLSFRDGCTRNLNFMSFRILIFIWTGSSEKSIELSMEE